MKDQLKDEFLGFYGPYTINAQDKNEVKLYRVSLLICGLGYFLGISQWILLGPSYAWLWLIPMTLGLGSCLKWIHIYIKILHQLLQLSWIIGCIGILALLFNYGGNNLLSELSLNPLLTIAIGPFFISLTGLGFKEFFCFRKPEAIGLTFLLPITLISHIAHILSGRIIMGMLLTSSILLLLLAIRKLGSDPSVDIGDKSVFEYLKKQKASNSKINK
ncbi:DUF2301 domain-containing membrane protein [Prochlorococcus sp. MIT 1223]|uniref:DUF2301 domain-containing membrane protein n=1 Tax=Prochlorococcus sp. MIT 1223 TaxID=3096217 RepID=UPI002A751502|nr:DUF2301 domain-containing membrane protein [Prochlorococcus sp. MIT 1223]